jgi:hypothetical protein
MPIMATRRPTDVLYPLNFQLRVDDLASEINGPHLIIFWRCIDEMVRGEGYGGGVQDSRNPGSPVTEQEAFIHRLPVWEKVGKAISEYRKIPYDSYTVQGTWLSEQLCICYKYNRYIAAKLNFMEEVARIEKDLSSEIPVPTLRIVSIELAEDFNRLGLESNNAVKTIVSNLVGKIYSSE